MIMTNDKCFPKRDFKIYAVDFDGTLTLNSHCEPNIAAPNKELFTFLIEERKLGNKVILWTCREDVEGLCGGKLLTEAVEFCRENGLEFDTVNDNIPEIKEFYGVNVRKITADYYIDDKSLWSKDLREKMEIARAKRENVSIRIKFKRELMRTEHVFMAEQEIFNDQENFNLVVNHRDRYDFAGCPTNYQCFSEDEELVKELDEFCENNKNDKNCCINCWKKALREE